ncbi:MAG: RNA polymerase-binding transcription factor [Parcubacteria group bacterium ADurb.Bin316]|nr:MAG: RNA polymerase-binding transcription factor [Parcubacteria group bacterium ADurb.Bin316]HOZ55744.1 TraR/DksA family transcriptional regulator [bacterium]
MLDQNFIEKMQTRLIEEKERVEAEIKKLKTPEEPMDNPDIEDLSNDATEDLLEEQLLAVHKNILAKIDDALLRIKDGTYGRCLICGAEISEEDLEKEPWAEHCRSCKQ